MADEGFNKLMKKLDEINGRLSRISGEARDARGQIPSTGFIVFWMGFVPFMAVLLTLIGLAIYIR